MSQIVSIQAPRNFLPGLLLRLYLFMLLVLFPAFAFAENNLHQDSPGKALPKDKEYWRATLETTSLLGVIAALYWGTRTFSEDFDYDVSWSTLGKKFSGEAIRFDDNSIAMNSFPGHALAGAYYYLIPRNHHLSRFESLIGSFLTSSAFEFFIEFPEVVSINDMIVTPLAGSSIGEAMYHFGKYFRCAKDRNTRAYKILSVMSDPIEVMQRAIWQDARNHVPERCADTLSITQDELSVSGGFSTVLYKNSSGREAGLLLGFSGKLYLLPDYGQESDISVFLKDTVLVKMFLETILSDDGLDSLSFYTKTIWAAYHRQNIMKNERGNLAGYSFLLGPASAFEHTQYKAKEFEDVIAAVHVFGPSMELTFFNNKNHIRIGLDVFGDFSMVRSFAMEEYSDTHPVGEIKSVLRERNYYYAYGVTVHPILDIKHGPYRFIAEYKYSYYDSFEGADRRGRITNDFNVIDERQEYQATVGRFIDFIDTKFFQLHQIWAEVTFRHRERSGFIADDEVSHQGATTWFMLQLRMMPYAGR